MKVIYNYYKIVRCEEEENELNLVSNYEKDEITYNREATTRIHRNAADLRLPT
jgi:hypothetical protein